MIYVEPPLSNVKEGENMEKYNKNYYFSVVFSKELEKWKSKDKKHNTQEEFACLVGLSSKNSITDYKKGKTFPTEDTLQAMADIFNIDVSTFTIPNSKYLPEVMEDLMSEYDRIVFSTPYQYAYWNGSDVVEIVFDDNTKQEIPLSSFQTMEKEIHEFIEFKFNKLRKEGK